MRGDAPDQCNEGTDGERCFGFVPVLGDLLSEISSASGRLHEVRFVLWAVLVLNLFVALAKLGYGLFTGSLGMQADGFHSLFDGVSNVIGLVNQSTRSGYIRLGRIDIGQTKSWVQVDTDFVDEVEAALRSTKHKGRTLWVERTNGSPGRSHAGSGRRR